MFLTRRSRTPSPAPGSTRTWPARSATAKSASTLERQVAEIASPVGVIAGPGPGDPPGGHVHLQGLDCAQGSQRDHSQSQPAGTAGVATRRSADPADAARDGRARRPGAVAGRRQQPADDRGLDESPARRAGSGDGRPGDGSRRVSVGHAGHRCGARKRPGADQRRRRSPRMRRAVSS